MYIQKVWIVTLFHLVSVYALSWDMKIELFLCVKDLCFCVYQQLVRSEGQWAVLLLSVQNMYHIYIYIYIYIHTYIYTYIYIYILEVASFHSLFIFALLQQVSWHPCKYIHTSVWFLYVRITVPFLSLFLIFPFFYIVWFLHFTVILFSAFTTYLFTYYFYF
jgi:hypothetical protein